MAADGDVHDDARTAAATRPMRGGLSAAETVRDHTQTSTELDAQPPSDAPRTLGRYAIERVLGAGGMGVVYEAYDRDLERRVALKVLPHGDGSDRAEQRLLREARAMARLTHPNVVAVYEVGSADGRDFIAMELIDGEPLVQWLRAEQRSADAILEAFVAAGQGLAAAHAASVVHRDFKPHNVLRSASGRIVVTDFGLAREASDVQVQQPASRNTPTSLSGLTVSGAVLGTPAYMAPEQWIGGKVTPATDQFAFCIALWEAVAGERPYRGTTGETLREQVIAGPAALDASRIPRRLRAVLRRGLEPDPRKRWPSMALLLERLVHRPRARYVAVLGGAAVVGAIVAATSLGSEPAGDPGCPPPAIDPAKVFTAEHEARLQAIPRRQAAFGSTFGVLFFRHTIARWNAARASTCSLPPTVRARRLDCLDRVLARIDLVTRAKFLDLGIGIDPLKSLLPDPQVCELDNPPGLPASYSEAAVIALAIRGNGKLPDDVRKRATDAAADDHCARALLLLPGLGVTDNALRAAELCGDHYVHADASVRGLIYKLDDVDLPDALRDAERSVARAAHPILARKLAMMKARVAKRRGEVDNALASYLAAATGTELPNEWYEAVIERAHLLLERGAPADVAAARRELAAWRIVAIVDGFDRNTDYLDFLDATAAWAQGDVAVAHARLWQLHGTVGRYIRHRRQNDMQRERQVVSGAIVDAVGHPVAGATVIVGETALGDSVGVATPLLSSYAPLVDIERVVSDERGRFTVETAPRRGGVIVAQHGVQRSRPVRPTKGMRLQLQPTTRITGRVAGAGSSTRGVSVLVKPDPELPYAIAAPLAPDHSFSLDGVPVSGEARIAVAYGGAGEHAALHWQPLELGAPASLVLQRPHERSVRVIVRSETTSPILAGAVALFSGVVRAKAARDLEHTPQDQAFFAIAYAVVDDPPRELATAFERGDALATFTTAPAGPGTVCAFGVQGRLGHPDLGPALRRHARDLDVHCQPLPADATTVTIVVPPTKRIE